MNAKVVTRAAPTVSGALHLGTLYNAVLNYCFARSHNGSFFLRLDGSRPSNVRREIGNLIIRDLEQFGIKPDKIIWQMDRKTVYREILDSLIGDHRIFFCDCLPGHIFERTRFTPDKLKGLVRNEKFPGACEIRRVRIFDAASPNQRKDVASGKDVKATSEAEGFAAQNVTSDEGTWKAFERGFVGSENPRLIIDLKEQIWVSEIEIQWDQYPIQVYEIRNDRKEILATSHRPNKFYVEGRPWGPVETNEKDRISFTPVLTRSIEIRVKQVAHQIMREYFYDGHCRELDKRLDLNDPRTVIRVRSSGEKVPDAAIYIKKNVNLILTSAIDDKELGITHSLRGADIFAFALLEREAARLIDYEPRNIFHTLVTGPGQVKLSKFVRSPAAVSFLEISSPEEIICGLCRDAKILSTKENLSLDELSSAIDYSAAFIAVSNI